MKISLDNGAEIEIKSSSDRHTLLIASRIMAYELNNISNEKQKIRHGYRVRNNNEGNGKSCRYCGTELTGKQRSFCGSIICRKKRWNLNYKRAIKNYRKQRRLEKKEESIFSVPVKVVA